MAGFCGYSLANSSLFDLSEVQVVGNTTVTMEDILEASGLRTGSNILKISRQQAAEGIQDIPFIKSVDIARNFPSKMTITVTERTPKYLVYFGNRYLALDEELRCLYEASLAATANWPVPVIQLSSESIMLEPGEVSEDEGLKAAAALLDQLDPFFLENIKEIDAPSQWDMSVINLDGLRVYFGPPDNLPQKLQNYEELVIKNAAECNAQKLEYIDLRYDTNPVIKKK
ncbi:MAG: FtsQ-type POTRA domain-containing protein [Peptococcaceae bacterium]|nr:FtsQ-type POTRA domain-containing protein [Peptococcaceae bacterium]